ncbi:MAG TPA: NAD-binding protein [Anaerolineales bacterium]|nr:NAD-binding protein [Anaerolineales bacterium]
MRVIVVGCGRVGSELAFRLFEKGHKVTVVDTLHSAFENLDPRFRGRTIEGEALNQEVLQRAGIEQADGIAVVTNSDTLNTVIAHVAKSVFQVPNVVARNYDPNWRNLHEVFDLQVVSTSSWGAQRIEELLYHQEMRTVFSAGNGEVEIYEFTVPEALNGKTLGDLIGTHECIPVAITRSGKAILPGIDSVVHAGDAVLVSATFLGTQNIRNLLGSLEEA